MRAPKLLLAAALTLLAAATPLPAEASYPGRAGRLGSESTSAETSRSTRFDPTVAIRAG